MDRSRTNRALELSRVISARVDGDSSQSGAFVLNGEAYLRRVAAAAIRMVRHDMEYVRQVQLNRCNGSNVGGITIQWEKLVAARNQLERAVKLKEGK